jgi:3-oxoacyl-[acyl-carrier-protein] synthase II
VSDASAVAIIGMSGRFPGARDIGEYWDNLRSGIGSVTDFSPRELQAAGVADAESLHPDYVPAKGYLSEADRFEAELFGFNPAEAAALDPQHRLLLEAAWSALEDAGYSPRHAPERTGVYVGGSLTEHMIAAHADPQLRAELGDLHLRTLTDREFLAPWLSYRLDLSGPSLTVQTACSTSLTATHLAVQALLLGECDTALAGGVCVDSLRKRGYRYRAGDIYAPDGRCRPFDEKAAGTVGGNGVGVVVLRRLTDALADGDPIRAVIWGTAATNDGSGKVGFAAPGVSQQTAAIVEAWALAGLEPAAAQYLEMHGTATPLGDQVEVAAVSAASAACAIGSVKSNLGHLDAAAGIAGLIKVVLMLEHQSLVPTVNVTCPRADLGRLRLVTEAEKWEQPGAGPRLAGVTSLGIGGTNVHVVLAEAPARAERPAAGRLELLPVSARTPDQLAQTARRLAARLREEPVLALADIAHTLQAGRASLAVRGYVIARSVESAADALADMARSGRAGTGPVPAPRGTDSGNGDGDSLRALGERWARGEDVAWPPRAPGAGRVHLPSYPFAGPAYGSFLLGPRAAVARPDDDVAGLLVASLGLTGPADLDQTYFGAGGDSLTAINLIGRIRDELSIDVPVDLFFADLSLSELADRITSADRGTGLASLLDELEQ